MCFVNGCSTPGRVPPDKAVSERRREDKRSAKVGGGEIKRVTTGKTEGEGNMSAVELRGDKHGDGRRGRKRVKSD